MLIVEQFTIEAPRDRVASYLLDVYRVAACVPGVQDVTQAGDGRYEATLRIQLGPIRAQFAGEVTVDGSEAPDRLVASGQGRDRQTGSQAKVEFTADLSDTADGHTQVASRADVAIRGKLGQFGTGVITSTATSMVRAFADCASQTLAAEVADSTRIGQSAGDDGTERRTQASAAIAQPKLGRVIGRGLWLYVKRLWAKVRRRGGPPEVRPGGG